MVNKRVRRQKIRWRIRKSIHGTSVRPRLSVFRSNKQIYCQLIDDVDGTTICAASSRDEGIKQSGKASEVAKQVGTALAEKAKKAKVETIIFDRSGYLYHGRVKALAEGAREAGLKF